MLAVDHIRDHMAKNSIQGEIIILGENEARTSVLAANAVGCSVSQIGKTIVLAGKEPFIVILSGDRKVDLARASKAIGHSVKLADARTVQEETGFPVGGVPPFGHLKPIRVFVDRSLNKFEVVYCSAGSAETLLRISLRGLMEATRAQVVDFSY